MKDQIKQLLIQVAEIREFKHVGKENWIGKHGTKFFMTMDGFITDTTANREQCKFTIIE